MFWDHTIDLSIKYVEACTSLYRVWQLVQRWKLMILSSSDSVETVHNLKIFWLNCFVVTICCSVVLFCFDLICWNKCIYIYFIISHMTPTNQIECKCFVSNQWFWYRSFLMMGMRCLGGGRLSKSTFGWIFCEIKSFSHLWDSLCPSRAPLPVFRIRLIVPEYISTLSPRSFLNYLCSLRVYCIASRAIIVNLCKQKLSFNHSYCGAGFGF